MFGRKYIEVPGRPGTWRTIAAASVGVVFAAALAVGEAQALPGQCGGGGFGGHSGHFCDTDPWSDGSFLHHERVCVFGICGSNSFRACHHDPDGPGPAPAGRVPTDNDPSTPC